MYSSALLKVEAVAVAPSQTITFVLSEAESDAAALPEPYKRLLLNDAVEPLNEIFILSFVDA